MSKKIPLLAAALTLVACSLAFAQSDEGEKEGRGQRRGPPPEAIQACASLTEGDTCSFEGRRGAMEGTCRTGPKGKGELACAPARGGRRR